MLRARRARGRTADGRDRGSATSSSTRRRAACCLDGQRARALAQGVRPARRAGAQRRPGRHARGPDVARSGTSTGSARRRRSTSTSAGCARKLGDDPAEPRYIQTVRGVGFRFAAPDESAHAVSLRTRLLLALAYVLLLAIVALGVPLALSLRDRVDAEVRSQARRPGRRRRRSAADLLASPLERARAAAAGRHPRPRSVRGRVIVVDARGRVLADSAGAATVGAGYANRPEIAAALRGHREQRARHSSSIGADLLATAVPVLAPRPRSRAPSGSPRASRSVHRAVQPHDRGARARRRDRAPRSASRRAR